jgi:hypothetical protein
VADKNAQVGNVGVNTTFAGGLTSAGGALLTGFAQGASYSYQAALAKMNAKLDLQNADYSRQVGEDQSAVAGLRGAQTQGKIKAAQGSSGLDVNSGSAVDVRAGQQKMTELDIATIRSNAARDAYNWQVKAAGDSAQASQYGRAAIFSDISGGIKAAGDIGSAFATKTSQGLQAGQTGLSTSTPSIAGSGSSSVAKEWLSAGVMPWPSGGGSGQGGGTNISSLAAAAPWPSGGGSGLGGSSNDSPYGGYIPGM